LIKVAIITMSDKGYRGERVDETGPLLKKYVEENKNFEVCYTSLLPDDREMIKKELIHITDNSLADLILTNGGTGFSQRDITPEATMEVIEREVPGVPEYMRLRSFEITKKAMLSRSKCGIRKGSLILNLPGSPKGALENLSFVLETLIHGIEILKGDANECATKI
jgi:molybdenum cofactor synthesis domain-containing protein